MNKDFVKSIEQASTIGLEAVRKLNALNISAFERLTARQFDMASDFAGFGLEQLETVTPGTEPQAFAAAASRIATDAQAKITSHTQATFELWNDLRGEYASLVETGMKEAPAVVKPAARKAA